MIPMTLQKKPRANEDSHFSRWIFSDLIFFRYPFQMSSHHGILLKWTGPWFQLSDFNSFSRFFVVMFFGPTWRTQSFWNRKLLGGDSCLRMFWCWKLRRINIWKGVSFKNTPMSLECFSFKTTKNQWKRRVVIFPRQMPYHSFRKSLGGNRLVRKHPSKFEEWSWIPKNGVGNPRRYLWTNCRCHFPVYLVEVRRV